VHKFHKTVSLIYVKFGLLKLYSSRFILDQPAWELNQDQIVTKAYPMQPSLLSWKEEKKFWKISRKIRLYRL